MRTTFTVSYYCRESKKNREGLSPIEAVIHLNGERVNLNLPMKVEPKKFKKPNADLQNYLSAQRLQINRIIEQLTEAGESIDAYNLKQMIYKGSLKSMSLTELFNEYKEKVVDRKKITKSVYQKWLFDINLFFSLFDGSRSVKSFNKADVNRLMQYLNESYKPSTIEGHANRIKAFFLYAMDKEVIEKNPFYGLKLPHTEEIIEYLTKSEVDKIIALNSPIERLTKVKDLFLFLCGSGLSFCDAMGLDCSKDIQEKDGVLYITKPRQKTKVVYTSILLPFAIDVLKKYNYILPTISNQKLNSYLAEIADLTGISKTLHSHLGRKTYATLLLNNKVDILTVSKTLGHTNIRQTAHYAKKLQESIIEEVGSILNKF